MRIKVRFFLCILLTANCILFGNGQAVALHASVSRSLILATTTSTVDSGLLDVLIPIFEKQSGYKVKTIGVGSGMAMEMGRRGEADVLLVHSPKAEEQLVAEGAGINRKAVMHNDFVLLGTANDPAGIRSAKDAREAFGKICSTASLFISRGDKSGTHLKELSLWQDCRDSINRVSTWYLESGQGIGATLTIANQKKAYTLSDRATYLAFKDKIKLVILYPHTKDFGVGVYEGDKLLLNPYHVIELNPIKYPKVNAAGGKAFADFLVAPATQKIIANFGRDKYKESLFFGNAGK